MDDDPSSDDMDDKDYTGKGRVVANHPHTKKSRGAAAAAAVSRAVVPRGPGRPVEKKKLTPISSIPAYMPKLLESCSGRPAETAAGESTLVIDNGAYTAKYGLASAENPRIIPNFVGKPKGSKKRFVGEEIASCRDFSALFQHRPHDKGYLLNWDLQKEIWQSEHYFKSRLGRDFRPSELDLVLTTPVVTPESLLRLTFEHVFDEFQFRSLFLAPPQYLSYHHGRKLHAELGGSACQVVVDVGYSFAHVVPFFNGVPINHAIQRVNVGGKVLTNYLKELVSYRHYNMMDETYLMNVIKEKMCFVSSDFRRDLAVCNMRGSLNTIKSNYLLPDYTTSLEGFPITDEEKQARMREKQDLQILLMNNERITVPEVIFRPSDIGLNQCGIAEAIAGAIGRLPVELQEAMFASIFLVGGSSKFPGFSLRLESELRSLAPTDTTVKVFTTEAPITSAWHGAKAALASPTSLSSFVSRDQYLEFGDFITLKKFGWLV